MIAPALLDGLPPGKFSMNLAWDRAIAAGRLRAVVHDGLWFHLSTPADLAAAEIDSVRTGHRRQPMKLATIPAEMPFLDTLAARWLAGYGADTLARGLILLPTRRAARALAEAFLRAGGGRPMLLPRITALGAPDEAPLALAGALDLLPAVDPQERLGALAALVMKLPAALGGAGGADRALLLARELAALMDEAERAEIDLPTALTQAADAAHAEHWQATLRFLEIVTRAWPEFLDRQRADEPGGASGRAAARPGAGLDGRPARGTGLGRRHHRRHSGGRGAAAGGGAAAARPDRAARAGPRSARAGLGGGGGIASAGRAEASADRPGRHPRRCGTLGWASGGAVRAGGHAGAGIAAGRRPGRLARTRSGGNRRIVPAGGGGRAGGGGGDRPHPARCAGETRAPVPPW